MRLWLLTGLLALPLFAQDVRIEAPVPPKTSIINTNLLTAPSAQPKESPIKYSGLATDLKRSTNRWKFFSLRKPADPKTDAANLIHDTRAQAGPPIKLLSIDF